MRWYWLGLVCCGVAGCDEPAASPPASPAVSASAAEGPRKDVIARVNGAPITEVDLRLRLAADNHETKDASPEHEEKVLDALIHKEILAQKALDAGLDRDPKYQEGLRRMEAQVAAWKRQELAELLLAREADKRTTPTDDELRAYFEKNKARLRSRVHVLQILRRSEAAIVEVRSAIDRGQSFEDAAKGLFPGLAPGQTPWDLGYLAFYKVPEPWRETVYDLKPGEMSGILRGPNDRFWLVKLVDVKEDADVSFESVKDALIADMRATGRERSREAIEKELVKGAVVEKVRAPTPVRPPKGQEP